MGIFSAIKYALNSTLGTDAFQPLDEMITGHGVQEFTSSGTFTVPKGVHKIWVTACGGGGGGSGTSSENTLSGSGGAGGDCIARKLYAVNPGEVIDITIGTGGNGGNLNSSGGNGGNTIIGSLCTLVGGGGGITTSNYCNGGSNDRLLGGGGGGGSSNTIAAGCSGGIGFQNGFYGFVASTGDAANSSDDMETLVNNGCGGKSLYAAGGLCGYMANTKRIGYVRNNGGGGGASLGSGGNGAYYASGGEYYAATPGVRGGGGGGGARYSRNTEVDSGAKGGDGYCLIEW